MRLKSSRLTDEGIARIRLRRAGEPRLTAWDTDVRGFGVRVTTASRTFVLRFTPSGGKQTLVVLGDADGPFKIDVEAAREEARKKMAPGHALGSKATVDALLKHFETNHRTRKKKRPPTEDPDTCRRIALIRERWGKRRADEITHVDVAAVLLEITTRGAPYEANRVRALVRTIWNEARRLPLVPASMLNPVEGTPVNREVPRPMPALKPGEVVRLLAAAGRYPNAWAGGAVRLLALTGWRTREALALKWADVDLDEANVLLRDRKAGDTTTMAVGVDALAVLKSLPRQAGSPWVFPGAKRGAHLVALGKPWAKILAAAGLPAKTQIKDVRAAMATNIARTHGDKVAQRVLAHADIRTTMIYIRPDNDDLRAALDAHGRAATGNTAAKRTRKAGAR